jgi:hypothetical protein
MRSCCRAPERCWDRRVADVDKIADLERDFPHSGMSRCRAPSITDSLRKCTVTSPRAWQAVVNAEVVDADVVDADGVNDVENEVVAVFFPDYPNRVVEIFHGL